jgi:peptidoglycan/LPS O-acetylase OafA/YrhL
MIALELVKVAGLWTGFIVPARQPFSLPNTVNDIFLNIFLVQSLDTTNHLSWNSPSWSISCEAAGYLFFAIAAITGALRAITFQFVAVPMAIAGYVFVVTSKGTLDATYDLGIVRCLAGLLLGIWVYDLSVTTRISVASRRTLDIAGFCMALWIVVALTFAGGTLELAVIPGFVLALLCLHQDRGYAAKFLMTQPLAFLGRISYSVYMLHYFLIVALGIVLKRILPISGFSTNDPDLPRLTMNRWVGDLLLLAMVFLIVWLASHAYRRIEAPWREYGRVWVDRFRSRNAVVQTEETIR